MARLSLLVLAATTLSALQTASAHFTLTYPPTRGFDHDHEDVAPCGNFNSVGNRTEFPLQDGFVQITSGHTSYSYEVKLVTGSNPQTQDFNSSATTVAQGQVNHPEGACIPLNLGNNTQSGTNATIQVVFNGGDGNLYQVSKIWFTLQNTRHFILTLQFCSIVH